MFHFLGDKMLCVEERWGSIFERLLLSHDELPRAKPDVLGAMHGCFFFCFNLATTGGVDLN